MINPKFCKLLVPLGRLSLSLSIALLSVIYIILNKPSSYYFNVATPLDYTIPFNKYFIIPYVYWYAYIGLSLCFFAIKQRTLYYNFLLKMNTGMVISFIMFFLIPTTLPRPYLSGSDIFSRLVLAIYKNDNPYNCFPSIHVFESVLAALFINSCSDFSKRFKILSALIAVSIVISVLFVKQHYIADILAGSALAVILYIIPISPLVRHFSAWEKVSCLPFEKEKVKDVP